MKNFKVKKLPVDGLDTQIKIWEKSIDVQMHFNELQMKIRNFSVLLISALVGAAGLALKDRIAIDHQFLWMHLQFNLSAAFFVAAAVTWLAFAFMDHYWYYPLLLGAVRHAAAIEETLKEKVPGIGLTTRIGDESPKTFKIELRGRMLYEKKLRSKDKSKIFYGVIFFLLAILAVGSMWVPTVDAMPKQNTSVTHNKSVERSTKEMQVIPAQQNVPTSPFSATFIVNQDFHNGQAPVSIKKNSSVNLDVKKPKSALEKCVSADPICKKEEI